MKDKLPFFINRNDSRSLTNQVTDGLRAAINSGFYRPGDLVPGVRPLAELLGVSTIITRAALHQLGEEGLLMSRHGTGTIVVDRDTQLWKGRVLYAASGHNEHYVFNEIGDVLRERLFRLRYQYQRVPAWGKLGSEGMAQLECALNQGYELVVLAAPSPEVVKEIEARGLRVVEIYEDASPIGKNSIGIHFDHRAGTESFVAHCRAAGIRQVISVGLGTSHFGSMTGALRETGIKVDTWTIKSGKSERGVIARVGQRTLELFERKLNAGQAWLPDLFHFADDYIAEAALLAFAHHKVRIPEDVKVVTWENVGLGPLYYKTLTRFSFDARQAGQTVADVVANLLSNKEPVINPIIAPQYLIGESFPEV